MAIIDSVKLPDNSTYDVADNHSGYAKKVASATTDDLASLTATGDLADSGKKLSDLVLKSDVKDVLNSTDATKPLSANMGHTLGEEIDAIVNVYGAKNLLPNNMQSSSGTGYSITVGSDKTVVFDGTVPYNFYQLSTFMLKAGTYILSVSDTATGCMILIDNDNNQRILNTNTSGQFTLNSDTTCKCYLYTNGSSVYSNTTFYPMIRDARIVDPTYQPYVPTNQQLTVNKANRADLASLNLTGTKNTTGATITAGTYFYLNGRYCRVIQDIGNNADFTENTNYVVTSLGGDLQSKFVLIGAKVFMASADGVKTYQTLINDVMTQLQSWISSHPNHGYVFNFLYVGGASGLPTDCNVRAYYTDMVFNQIGVTNTQFFMRYIHAKTSASESYRGVGTLTLTDESYEISQYDVHLYIHDYQIL